MFYIFIVSKKDTKWLAKRRHTESKGSVKKSLKTVSVRKNSVLKRLRNSAGVKTSNLHLQDLTM